MFKPPYRIKNMMPGMIMLWYGSVATIPSGWALCNGANGTPNLISKFIMGAGTILPAPGSTGGSTSHGHTFTGDGHAHDLASGVDITKVEDGQYAHYTNTVPATGDTNDTDGRPPYHVLCYIMKLPIP